MECLGFTLLNTKTFGMESRFSFDLLQFEMT
jgi:hypothetical protein